jgi:hypothetical protein
MHGQDKKYTNSPNMSISDHQSEKNDVVLLKNEFEVIKEESVVHEETIDPQTPKDKKKSKAFKK